MGAKEVRVFVQASLARRGNAGVSDSHLSREKGCGHPGARTQGRDEVRECGTS